MVIILQEHLHTHCDILKKVWDKGSYLTGSPEFIHIYVWDTDVNRH